MKLKNLSSSDYKFNRKFWTVEDSNLLMRKLKKLGVSNFDRMNFGSSMMKYSNTKIKAASFSIALFSAKCFIALIKFSKKSSHAVVMLLMLTLFIRKLNIEADLWFCSLNHDTFGLFGVWPPNPYGLGRITGLS